MKISWQSRQTLCFLSILAASMFLACVVPEKIALAQGSLKLAAVNPTPFFPKVKEGEPLQQRVDWELENPGKEGVEAEARITLKGQSPITRSLGLVKPGKSVVSVLMPDVSQPTNLVIELLEKGTGRPLAQASQVWQPQKKWTLYCVSYSHQDLGFGDYPHRLRTTIRHANIQLPLQFCRETDGWPKDDQYRFMIETSEPITSFISFAGEKVALELAQRIREGRIQLGGMHNTAETEQYGHELMARQFYLAGRHSRDLLDIPKGKTVQQDDVIGQSWPFATYAREAGYEYFFHGNNRLSMPNVLENKYYSDFPSLDSEIGVPILVPMREPAFYWQGPDGQSLLTRETTYERHSLLWDPYEKNPSDEPDPRRIQEIIKSHEKQSWPFSCFLSQDGGDFMLVKRTIANRIHKWNSQYLYPHLVSATMDMYFNAIAAELQKVEIKTLALDGNSGWSDMDSSDARLIGRARRMNEAIPATEKLATLAMVLAGGGNSWIDLYQAYHRLLQYHEHTNGKASLGTDAESWRWYETEQEENREMVAEADEFQTGARIEAQQRLSRLMTLPGEQNLVVFNPLPLTRSGLVKTRELELPENSRLVDAASGQAVAWQRLPDGTIVFAASEVPATGYRVYLVEKGEGGEAPPVSNQPGSALESPFYRLEFDPQSGVVTSLYDKELKVELVEQKAPHGFNQYLYEWVKKRDDREWFRLNQAKVSMSRGPVAEVLTIVGQAMGAEQIKQTIVLYRGFKQVDFSLWLDKSPYRDKEAVYIALPLAVPGFTIRHELPGAVIEPYRQQFEGSSTAHFAIRSFTDLSNANYGVTICPVENSLICYGQPNSSPFYENIWDFQRSQQYPTTSRVYLYLMNNMFNCNIPVDQRGPVDFHWSLRSHPGDWKTGQAEQFGRQVSQPLVVWEARGPQRGAWREAASFMKVEAPNVTCSTLKPAEANGRGLILRLQEMTGVETRTRVSLPCLGYISSVVETSLVEDNRGTPLPIKPKDTFTVTLKPFGVKTVRILREGEGIKAVGQIQARAVADMQVELTWLSPGPDISHYNIYRDTGEKCEPQLLNLVGQAPAPKFTDRPRLNQGGWIRTTLEPATTYYYRVVPVDRWNNPGAPSATIKVTTLTARQKNLPPVKVEALRAILVSPISKDNFVNLLFRTACESDISRYEIHRSTRPDFMPDPTTEVGRVGSDEVIKGSQEYGHTPLDYPVKSFDHAMFRDDTVEPGTTYYYQVCAVDTAGQRGEFSEQARITTK